MLKDPINAEHHSIAQVREPAPDGDGAKEPPNAQLKYFKISELPPSQQSFKLILCAHPTWLIMQLMKNSTHKKVT